MITHRHVAPLIGAARSAFRRAMLAAVTTALAAAATAQAQTSSTPPSKPAANAAAIGAWGFDAAGMDRSVKPGDDFFLFTSGVWAKNVVIPPDRSIDGPFSRLDELSVERCREILESLKGQTEGDRGRLAALYASYMDEAAVEALDAKPVQPLLDEIRAARTLGDMCALMGRASAGLGVSAFNARVSDDPKEPDYYSLRVFQSGLGLGDREFYLRDSFANHRAKYREYIASLLGMVNWPDASAAADKVLAFETELANAHWSIAQSRQVEKTYNPMTPAELESLTPGFDWPRYFEGARLAGVKKAIISQKSAFPEIASALQKADLATLQSWAAFHAVDGAAPLLSKRFTDAHFAFRQGFLNGVPAQEERWKRGVRFVERAMGEALGREYVERFFPASSKAQVEALVENLRASMKSRIQALDWMTPDTKAKALDKLSKFGLKIGYPSKWRDYSSLEIKPGDLVGNSLRARRHNADFWAARLGKPVDRADFGMTPQTVNAYYSSTRNEIVFPAAILQPPFFDPAADAAVNYGGIGAVIGHEITHGFDDQGRKSDGEGRLTDWWTAADAEQFVARSKALGATYEAVEFQQFPSMRLKAEQTMGENIADLGGLLLALDAYRLSLKGKPAPEIDGFSGVQRVFLGWAQVWRVALRDEALRQRIINDVHSPGPVRAATPPRHIDEWYRAFGVQPGDKSFLPPDARARIW